MPRPSLTNRSRMPMPWRTMSPTANFGWLEAITRPIPPPISASPRAWSAVNRGRM
jgi:hypothetical protein